MSCNSRSRQATSCCPDAPVRHGTYLVGWALPNPSTEHGSRLVDVPKDAPGVLHAIEDIPHWRILFSSLANSLPSPFLALPAIRPSILRNRYDSSRFKMFAIWVREEEPSEKWNCFHSLLHRAKKACSVKLANMQDSWVFPWKMVIFHSYVAVYQRVDLA
jgi:hypothetical protein